MQKERWHVKINTRGGGNKEEKRRIQMGKGEK